MERTDQQAGFSLIELVISVTILTVIMTAAFTLMAKSQINFDAIQIKAESHQNADFAIHRVTEIIRGAGANPLNGTNVAGIDFISNPGNDTTKVRLISDLNSDGDFGDWVVSSGAGSFIVASEDVTLQLNAEAETLEIIDNTGGVSGDTSAITIAENVLDFTCPVVGAGYPYSVLATVIAKSSRQLPLNDPRSQAITTTTQIQLRNI